MGVVRSLARARQLRGWATTIAISQGSRALSVFPGSIRRRMLARAKSRQVPADIVPPVETIWPREAARLAAIRLGFSDKVGHRIWEWAELHFDAQIAARWSGRVPCIYGCEHASLATYRKQREAGGFNLRWQVIAHHRIVESVLRQERERFPGAVTPYSEAFMASEERITRRKDEELQLSDLVVCNSDYVRRSFVEAGFPAGRVVAVPTGCPQVNAGIQDRRENASHDLFVYAGTLSLRKGLPYLMEAWRKLRPGGSAQLWLIGKAELPRSFFQSLPDNVQVRPPMPHDQLLQILQRAAVFVFPTLCEGRARVVLEAAASGAAILTTPNAGCEDIVESGVNGWTVAPRDSDAIAEKIDWFLRNPARLPQMWAASIEKAKSWGDHEFGAEHARVIGKFLAQKGLADG